MNIRTKLTLIFILILIAMLGAISISIYFFSADYRQADFYRRLKNRAMNTANVLIEVKEVNAELLRRMEQNNPASLPNQYIAIYNEANVVLYQSEAQTVIEVDDALLNEIRKKKELTFEAGEREVLAFTFSENSSRLTIVAAAMDFYGKDALRNLKNVLIITLLISLIFVSLLGWFYSGRVLSPISRIVNEVSNITAVNLDRRLDEGNRKDELAKLALTFNKMLAHLQDTFVSQKNFIANASHEIKTPITIMSGEIDVALLHDRDKAYYIKILRSVAAGLKGLNRLSGQLLTLAQTNADHGLQNISEFRLDDILWEIKSELLKAHSDYVINIDFDLDINSEALVIRGDEQLIKVAVMNLMDNGCKYADDKTVNIDVRSTSQSFIELQFKNNGRGIPHEILDKIFDPFFRGTADKKIRGFGIGLSLVKRIVEIHQGSINVESRPHETTKFTVHLPVVTR